MLGADGMHHTVVQSDRPTERASGDTMVVSGSRGVRADEVPAAAKAAELGTASLAREDSIKAALKRCNRRIGPYYFSTEDKLGKGVYGEVYRAYVSTQSPSTRPSESSRETYEEVSVTTRELPHVGDGEWVTIALKRMVNPAPADGWTAATLREISVLKELGNTKSPEDRAGFIPHARAFFPRQTPNGTSRRPSMRSWSGLTDFQQLTTSTTAGLSQDDDLNSFATASAADSSTTPAQMRPLELPSTFTGRRRQLTAAQRAVKDGAHCIIELYKFMLDDTTGTAYLATELCEGGDLHAFLRKKTGTEQRINDPGLYKRWMRQILQGVAFMHSRHISHRDLKPQNVLLKKRPTPDVGLCPSNSDNDDSNDAAAAQSNHPGWQYNLKVGDFGLSRIEDIPIKKYEHEAITLGYRSPDALLGNLYLHFAADVWSLGCILLESASGQPMFRGHDDDEQLKRILVRFGGVDKESFPSATKYSHSARSNSLFVRLIQYHRDESSKESYQLRFAAEMKQMHEQEAAYSPEFLDYTSHQEPRHVAVIRLHLRDYFSRHPGLDVLGEDGLDLISRMLMLEPSARLTLEGTLAHPFFAAETSAGDLDDDDQMMEIHDLDDAGVQRAPWMTQAESDGLAPPAGSNTLVNPSGRPPILASRGSNTIPGQPGAMSNDAVLLPRGDAPKLANPGANNTTDAGAAQTGLYPPGALPHNSNGRPSASYVLPPYLAQQQQRLSQSASEVRTPDSAAGGSKNGAPVNAASGMRGGQVAPSSSGIPSRPPTSRSLGSAYTEQTDQN